MSYLNTQTQSDYLLFLSEENELSDNTVCLGVEKKVLVVDCRSYSVAFANRVKGGGSECTGIPSITSCYQPPWFD